MQGSSHCNNKVPIRQAPGGQSRFSNQYFLSSELLLRVKEYTMWTTKRTLSGYIYCRYITSISESFSCNNKVPIRQAPGGQSRFSNQYFLSSELLLRVKEYTMWTTKRTLSGYIYCRYITSISESFSCMSLAQFQNLINSCHSWPSSSVGWTDLL